MPILFADKLCLDSTVTLRACAGAEPPLPTDWFDRANTFVSANGEKPGRGWILLARNSLDEISLTADHELTFFSSPGQVQTLKKITLIGSANLTPGVTEEARAAFLCEVADRRYHLSRIPCNVAYNVRSASTGDLLDESLNSSVAWTWEEVVEDLWSMLGLGTVPDLPFTPDGDPENLAYWGGWAWIALNDVLDRIGCTVRYWAEEDEFTFVRLGEDDATSDAEADKLDSTGMRTWDSEPFDPVRAWRPQKVRVRFQRSPLPTDGSSPYFTEDVTLTATTGVVSGSYVQLDDDLAALGATGTPTNAADLTTRAAERAADWLRKRRYSDRPQLIVYRDIQPNAGALLGSVRGMLALEDRIGARTSTKSEPDGAMEKWKPLTGVPKWWPPGENCCGWKADYWTDESFPSGGGGSYNATAFTAPGGLSSTQYHIPETEMSFDRTGIVDAIVRGRLTASWVWDAIGGGDTNPYVVIVFGYLARLDVSAPAVYSLLTNRIPILFGQTYMVGGTRMYFGNFCSPLIGTDRMFYGQGGADLRFGGPSPSGLIPNRFAWVVDVYTGPPGGGGFGGIPGTLIVQDIGIGGTNITLEKLCCQTPDLPP